MGSLSMGTATSGPDRAHEGGAGSASVGQWRLRAQGSPRRRGCLCWSSSTKGSSMTESFVPEPTYTPGRVITYYAFTGRLRGDDMGIKRASDNGDLTQLEVEKRAESCAGNPEIEDGTRLV